MKAAAALFAHALKVTAVASIVIIGIPMLYEVAAVQLRLDANIYDFMNTFFLAYIIYFLHTSKKEKSRACYFEMDYQQDLGELPGFDEENPK